MRSSALQIKSSIRRRGVNFVKRGVYKKNPVGSEANRLGREYEIGIYARI